MSTSLRLGEIRYYIAGSGRRCAYYIERNLVFSSLKGRYLVFSTTGHGGPVYPLFGGTLAECRQYCIKKFERRS